MNISRRYRCKALLSIIVVCLLTTLMITSNAIPRMYAAQTNLAIGKSYSASSSYNSGSFGKEKAADGNGATWWRHLSTDTDRWWRVDLGDKMWVNRLILQEYLRNDGYRIWQYKVEYSDDGKTWTMLTTKGSAGVSDVVIGDNSILTFPAIKTQYLKFTILDKDPTEVAGLAELEIYYLPNLASGRSYEASSTYNSANSGISKGADRDGTTWWRHLTTDTAPWWQVDLGSVRTINEIYLREYMRNGAYPIWSFKVEESANGSDWNLLSLEGEAGISNVVIGEEKLIAFEPIDTRYIRFSILDHDPSEVSGLNELEIYHNTMTTTNKMKVSISNTVTGKTMPLVGYSATLMNEGSNQPAWLRYSNTNTIRWWVSPDRHLPFNAMSSETVSSVTYFTYYRDDFRSDPEGTTYINWSLLADNMAFQVDTNNKSLYTQNWTFSQLKQLGIDPMVELHTSNWVENDWSNYWHNWKAIYGTVYYLAKHFDVHMFQTPNEPDHTSNTLYGKPDLLKQIIRLYSDAVRSAIQDVNRIYGKSLVPILDAPVLAGSSNSSYDKQMLQDIRTDYAGNPITYNNVDWYDRHKYSTDPSSFQSQIDTIRSTMDSQLPTGVGRLPITYTEWNWTTAANWASRNETSDTPAVFSKIGNTWGLTMQRKVQGMYLFKFEQHATQNGNYVHYTYLGEKDPTLNIALHKPATASSEQTGYEASRAVDGSIADNSMWRSSEGAIAPQTLTIELQGTYTLRSAIIESGTDNGLKPNSKVLANANLQWWDGAQWLDIPNALTASASGSYHVNFTEPITTDKVRFKTSDAGELRIREIKLYESYLRRDIGGPMKSAEVTRLFAEGFKDGRDMLVTSVTGSSDSANRAFTSYDPVTDNYYVWLARASETKESVEIDLSALPVEQGAIVSVKEVSRRHFGSVVKQTPIPPAKQIELGEQPSNSIWLVTIPKGAVRSASMLPPTADAEVKLGTNAGTNYGAQSSIVIRQHSNSLPDTSAAYLKFDLQAVQPAAVKQAFLQVHGKKIGGDSAEPLTLHAYIIDDSSWNEGTITGSSSPNLNANSGFIEEVGTTAWPVGVLSFTGDTETIEIDVSKYVREYSSGNPTFLIVREMRYPGLDEMRDPEYVVIDSKEGTLQPVLTIRY